MPDSSVEIRPYADTDYEGVLALWRLAFPDLPAHRIPEVDIRLKLEVQRELFFVAVEGDWVVGTAMAGYDGHRGWVHYVGVHPERRHRGIGGMLMQRVEKDLAELGCLKLNFQVRESNREVVAFYKSLGYHIDPVLSMGKVLRMPGK